jgi:hypothetical protein
MWQQSRTECQAPAGWQNASQSDQNGRAPQPGEQPRFLCHDLAVQIGSASMLLAQPGTLPASSSRPVVATPTCKFRCHVAQL